MEAVPDLPSFEIDVADDIAIGIDLGTTNSCVGVWEGDQVTVIPNQLGNRTTPSIVGYGKKERLTGEAAAKQATRNAKNTVYEAKRLMGRRMEEPGLAEDAKHWPFPVLGNDKGMACVEVEFMGRRVRVTPEEISSAILLEMKRIAEAYLGRPVASAVITCPAYFNDAQRQATKDAGRIAGIDVKRIINEPTAAALAYGMNRISEDDPPQNLLIFDLGGGTLDVTLLTVDGGIFEVRATCGDTHLGGQDFDRRLVEYFATEFRRQEGEEINGNLRVMKKLWLKSRQAKHELSVVESTTVEIDELHNGVDFDFTITRTRFNELCFDLFLRCMVPVEKALKDAGMGREDVNEVILIGGSSRIPELQRMLSDLFDGKSLCKRINPDEAVAYGAAIQGANLSLSLEKKRGTRLSNITLMDVIPLSMGIALAGGKFSVLIPRNTTIPFKRSKTYYNNEDYQTFAKIRVYEGENEYIKDSRLLGVFTLRGLPERKRGKVEIEVTFSINANDVSAELKNAKKHVLKSVTIDKNKGLLDDRQLDRMAGEAKAHNERNETEVARMNALNELETLVSRVLAGVGVKGLDDDDGVLFLKETMEWISSNPTIDDIATRITRATAIRQTLETEPSESEEWDD